MPHYSTQSKTLKPTAFERMAKGLRLTDRSVQENRELTLTQFKERTWVDNSRYLRSPHLDGLDHLLGRCMDYIRSDGKDGIKLLQCSMPPRYGKTATLKYFIAWAKGIMPHLRTIYVSYSSMLANRSGKGVRDVIATTPYKDTYPGTLIDPKSSAQASWDLYRQPGGMDSRGIMAGITGLGADILVIDDLIKGEDEAQSETVREKLYEELVASAFTRRQGRHAVTIMVGTRWHLDDPIGRVLREQKGKWHQYNLPALLNEVQQEYDDRGNLIFERHPGQPLHSRVHDLDDLHRLEEEMPQTMWQALYQQDPILATGGFFKREWFARESGCVVQETPDIDHEVRFWDLAMSENPGSSYTVGVRLARCTDGHHYVTDVKRFRIDWGEVTPLIARTALEDGADVAIGIEKAAQGTRAVKDLNADPQMHGYTVVGYDVHRKKHIRALPLVGALQTGRLHLLEGVWNQAYIDEFVAFKPKGALYDDQVDASSGAWEMMDEFGAGMGWNTWNGF